MAAPIIPTPDQPIATGPGMAPDERFITTIDPWAVDDPNFPVPFWVSPHSRETILIRRALRPLLRSGQWEYLRISPSHDSHHHFHTYEVFGRPKSTPLS